MAFFMHRAFRWFLYSILVLVAAIWLTLITLVVTRGIKHSSYAQLALTAIETAVVIALIGSYFKPPSGGGLQIVLPLNKSAIHLASFS